MTKNADTIPHMDYYGSTMNGIEWQTLAYKLAVVAIAVAVTVSVVAVDSLIS